MFIQPYRNSVTRLQGPAGFHKPHSEMVWSCVKISSLLKDCKQYRAALNHFYPAFFFFFNNSFSHSSTFPHAAFSYSVNLHTVPAGNRHGGVGIDWHSHVGMEIKTLLLRVDSVRSQQSFWGIRELTQYCMSCNRSACEQFLVH